MTNVGALPKDGINASVNVKLLEDYSFLTLIWQWN